MILIKVFLVIVANQTHGQKYCVTGHVSNIKTGQRLEGASVIIKGTEIGSATNTSGEYRILIPSPGQYEVQASFIGFETANKSILINDEQVVVLDFGLKESYISLEGITVTSAREGITFSNRMTVIDVDKFTEATKDYRLEEILARMAGIDIYRTGTTANPSQLVSMRGYNDMRFIVAVDGRAWSSPTHNDCPIDWSALTTGDIERIELIRGGGSVLYDGAMGGVINIVRKKGITGKGFTRPKITAQIGTEDFRTKRGNIGIRGGIGPLGYFVSGGFDLSTGYLRNEQSKGYDFSGNLNYNLPVLMGQLNLSLKRHYTQADYPVINDPARADFDPNYPVIPEGSDLIRKWSDNVYPGGVSCGYKKMDFLDLVYEQLLKNAKITVNLFGNIGDDTTYAYNCRLVTKIDSITGDTTVVPELQQSVSVSNEYTYGAGCRVKVGNVNLHNFTFGADYRNLGTFRIERDTIMGVIIEPAWGYEAVPDWFRLAGFFAEDEFKATSAINLIMGVRWSYLDEWTMPTYKNPTTGDSGRIHFYYKALLPKISASYTFPDSMIIYTSVNRDWHVPNC